MSENVFVTELGSNIFIELLRNPQGLSGYDLYRTSGKAITVLKELRKQKLIISEKNPSKAGKFKYLNKVNFDGLVEYLNKAMPLDLKFTNEEKQKFSEFLAGLDYKNFLLSKSGIKENLGVVARIFPKAPFITYFGSMLFSWAAMCISVDNIQVKPVLRSLGLSDKYFSFYEKMKSQLPKTLLRKLATIYYRLLQSKGTQDALERMRLKV